MDKDGDDCWAAVIGGRSMNPLSGQRLRLVKYGKWDEMVIAVAAGRWTGSECSWFTGGVGRAEKAGFFGYIILLVSLRHLPAV